MILLAGNPGAGKTILSSKFIYEGAATHGEPGAYTCFAETRKKLVRDMKKFEVDFEPMIRRNKVEVLDLSIGSETEVQLALNQIFEAITKLKAKRLVVDAIAAMVMGHQNTSNDDTSERRNSNSKIYIYTGLIFLLRSFEACFDLLCYSETASSPDIEEKAAGCAPHHPPNTIYEGRLAQGCRNLLRL